MARPGRPAPPLDVLQSMINAILIETGKALRPVSTEGGRAPGTVNTRLRTTFPSAAENFHMALDELECEIIRAKSVLLRDLDEMRAKRIALENPVPILDEVVEDKAPETNTTNGNTVLGDELYTSPLATVKEERRASPEKQMSKEPNTSIPQPPAEIVESPKDAKVPPQGPTPPASSNDASQDSKPIGLGIITEGAPALDSKDLQQSSVDDLFGIDDSGDPGMHFDEMDFALDTATQNQDTSQTQNDEFDLSNFGSQIPNPTIPNPNPNTTTDDQNKLGDDLFAMAQEMGGGDGMDLDLDMGMGMAGAEDSVFDDMFFGAGDDDGGEINGEFDNAFFGID